jgi:hypothetical protein
MKFKGMPRHFFVIVMWPSSAFALHTKQDEGEMSTSTTPHTEQMSKKFWATSRDCKFSIKNVWFLFGAVRKSRQFFSDSFSIADSSNLG